MENINSRTDARSYWDETYGLPDYYSSYNELDDANDRLAELLMEQKSVELEIKRRDILKINQFKINRAIELYFLIDAGKHYLAECEIVLEHVGRQLEEYEQEFDNVVNGWENDELFPRNYKL